MAPLKRIVFFDYMICRKFAPSFLHNRKICWLHTTSRCCESPQTSSSNNDIPQKVTVHYEHGLPVFTIPLPSRKELCSFTLRPISDTVATLCTNLSSEDKGVDYVALYGKDGVRISGSTLVEHLLESEQFRLRINDTYYDVSAPSFESIAFETVGVTEEILKSTERLTSLNDLRSRVAALYAVLHVDQYKLERENMLIKKLEEVELELKPMIIVKDMIEKECQQFSTRAMWGVFIGMLVQTGFLARLTWWEYSWDIVEPVTYFVTYATVLATCGYFLITRQSFEYPSCHDRIFSKEFIKRAKKYNFNVSKYNELVLLRQDIQHDLKRLRDPLYQHLPANRLAVLESENAKRSLNSFSLSDKSFPPK